MRHRIYLHVVWTTRDRTPIIGLECARFLAGYLGRIARDERTQIICLGIVSTHVHLLIRVHPTTVLPRLVQRWKGGSAAVARRDHGLKLPWEPGYSVDSVSTRALEAVGHYVLNQHIHHPDQAIEGWSNLQAGG